MNRVLVTGATGFVGSVLCDELAKSGHNVRAALRRARELPRSISEAAIVGRIDGATEWDEALRDVDCVIHAAARAHILHDSPANASLYEETNAHGTRRLAEVAARSGVRRMILVSSIKVNGEDTGHGMFRASDVPAPRDAYGKSKWLAEQFLLEAALAGRFEVAIVRPPLVYGPGVRANFLRLLQWVDRGLPLPVGSVRNRRSIVSVWNLCSLLKEMVSNPAAAGRVWLVSDCEDLSTPALIRRIGSAMDRRPLLLPIPTGLLRFVGTLAGKRGEVDRLCGSLSLDVTPTRIDLNWSPPLSLDTGLARTVEWYKSQEIARGT
jgi:nucleoside-diphosphate-sugar epimerase